jgi:hypothetical protein
VCKQIRKVVTPLHIRTAPSGIYCGFLIKCEKMPEMRILSDYNSEFNGTCQSQEVSLFQQTENEE